jgi:translation initiation factor IF-2
MLINNEWMLMWMCSCQCGQLAAMLVDSTVQCRMTHVYYVVIVQGFVDLGKIASLELNHKPVDTAKKGEAVAMKIEAKSGSSSMKKRGSSPQWHCQWRP